MSGVFRTIDPHPLSTQRVCPPRTKVGGVHTRWAVRGWGVNISEDARLWIGLLKYNPSTNLEISKKVTIENRAIFLLPSMRYILFMRRTDLLVGPGRGMTGTGTRSLSRTRAGRLERC